MMQMRAGTGAKVRVVASGGDSHSKIPTSSHLLEGDRSLQADEKSTAPLFAGER
jgi:hypothetical protein